MNFNSIIIVSDFDFTLTDSTHNVPLANINAIRDFVSQGGLFTVGTGRSKNHFLMNNPLMFVNAPCILSNGAVIYDYAKDEIVRLRAFDASYKQKLYKLIEHLQGVTGVLIESGFDVFAPEEIITDNHVVPIEPRRLPAVRIPDPWLKMALVGEPEQVDAAQRISEELGVIGSRSLPIMYEIQASGVNKGSAARELANMYGRKVLVCIGDAPNDIQMLSEADYSFVPESASEAMKSLGFGKTCHMDHGVLPDVIAQLSCLGN